MRQVLIAVAISLAVSILLTPTLIRMFTRQGFGQEIREDGPPSHHTKRGTPSMGGVAILAGSGPVTWAPTWWAWPWTAWAFGLRAAGSGAGDRARWSGVPR